MIVAVTGSNGFIGRHLCAALRRGGHDVRAIMRADFASNRVEAMLGGVDCVVHAAAATRAPTHADLRRANVDLTDRMLAAARAAAVGRFVFVSSQAAAGPARALDEPVREDDTPAPIEEYGRTKLAAERLVAASGLDFTIVRPAAVYGSDDRDFAAAFALARRGIAVHPGNREQWISIIHVDDCVLGIAAAAELSAARGRTYFLANAAPVQWRDIYRFAAPSRQLHADIEIPSALTRAAAIGGDIVSRLTGRTSLLTSEKVKLAAPHYWVCSAGRAAEELSFLATIALEDGIAAAATGT